MINKIKTILVAFIAIFLCYDCFGLQQKDSITVYTAVDTIEDFIKLKKNKIKYSVDDKLTTAKKFFINVPVGLTDMRYHHVGNTDYCEFSYPDSSSRDSVKKHD